MSRLHLWEPRVSYDPLSEILDTHGFVHRDQVHRSAPFSLPESVTDGLSDTQLCARPGDVNAIAWHLWHLAFTEDEGLAVCAGLQPLFDSQAWPARLGYPRRNAHGMTKADSRELSETIRPNEVQAYRDAVGKHTRDVLTGRDAAYWLENFSHDNLEDAVRHGVWERGPAEGMAGFLLGQTRHALLRWWAANHSLLHLGQATTLRHQLLAEAT